MSSPVFALVGLGKFFVLNKPPSSNYYKIKLPGTPFTFNFACQVADKSAQELLMESQVWVPNPVRLQGWR